MKTERERIIEAENKVNPTPLPETTTSVIAPPLFPIDEQADDENVTKAMIDWEGLIFDYFTLTNVDKDVEEYDEEAIDGMKWGITIRFSVDPYEKTVYYPNIPARNKAIKGLEEKLKKAKALII